jgi:uncharacterized Zn finger protein
MAYGYGGYGGFGDYVSVAQKKARAHKHIEALRKRGARPAPVEAMEGRKLATSFWGNAWCQNLERYSDYANRLPRGRSYVRNGFVLDLQVARGRVTAIVQGSAAYHVEISVAAVAPTLWKRIVGDCTGQVASVVELLSGSLSRAVMDIVTRAGTGLFPTPQQIHLKCSCPDGAYMCKHIAAALYGVGARLDRAPELLFTLRHVDAADLVSVGVAGLVKGAPSTARALEGKLESIFGVELAPAAVNPFQRARPLLRAGAG